MDLTLYAESTWESPWVFHVMVALEELGVPYEVEVVPLPIPADKRAMLQQRAVLGKVPVLVDGELWLTESAAITEYLAERFAPPQFPPIMPVDRVERARARQVMSWLRTSLAALRSERPTSSVFQEAVGEPLSDKARADALELMRVAERLIPPDRASLASTWCVADADLALALMRLVANNDTMHQRLMDYAISQFKRPSVRKFLANVPTQR